jgi:PAS domain S-box-containing protein
MMTNDEKARQLFRRLTPFDLPIGVYLVAPEGRFLECDRRVRAILKLPPEGPPNASILDFYRDPAERARLLHETQEAEGRGKHLERQLIAFQVEGREVWVRDYCRSLRDPETDAVIGYAGCLVDVTEEERYQRLFERLPAGVYQVDADDRLVRVNEAVVRMFGYESGAEMEGRHVEDLYADPGQARVLRAQVQKEESVVNRVEELVKKNGETFFVSVSAFQSLAPDGSYAGREGTLLDVTAEERYRRSLNDVPVGFYEVRLKEEEDVISQCNEQFARMFDFDNVDEVIETRILQLYANPDDYRRFRETIRAKDQEGEPLLGFHLRVRSHAGREFVIEVNSRLIHGRSGAIVGRTGVVRDVTAEVKLRERLDEMLNDIGQVLHPFSSMLLMVQHALTPLGKALGPTPFEGDKALTAEEVDAALIEPAARAAGSLAKLLALADAGRGATALSAEQWDRLAALLRLFQEYRRRISVPEFRPSALRDASRKVIEICADVQRGRLPREPVRQVQRDAEALERLACHVDLLQARTAVLQMDHQVRTLRDFVTTGARAEEPRSVRRLSDLVSQAIRDLAGFARNQGVEIRRQDDCPKALVRVAERDVVRALTNLLHNAIKYSWHPDPQRPRWVAARSFVVEGQARVAFESYGVPITRQEIDQELIFQIGYRGVLSRDRGRLGTGIGLLDARNVAHSHGGDVSVDSRPASPGAAEDNYTGPFVTTATMTLPLYE